MSSFPLFPQRKIHQLDGCWDFAFVGDCDDTSITPDNIQCHDKIAVPGVFDACPEWAGKRGIGVFKTQVAVAPGCRSLLKFGGLGLRAKIFVDNELMKEWQLPYSGFSLELPPSQKSVRSLGVVIDNRFNFERTPLFEQFFDFYGYGGIYRSVEWHELPSETAFDRVRISVKNLKAGAITARIDFIETVLSDNIIASLAFEIDGLPVTPQKISASNQMIFAELKVPSPVLWTPETPTLHLLKVTSANDVIVERFGLRTVTADHGRICLNGNPVKLKGFCRHESHPQYGPALPLAQLIQDLQHLKRMGCNFVRGAHYPQDQRFLDLCDETGIMVFEESLGWGQREQRHAGEGFARLQEQQTRLMVRNSFNHPAIILWGILNEGGSDLPFMRKIYRDLLAALREEDASRLVTFASNVPDRDLNFDLGDVIALNIYPGWYTDDAEKIRPLDEIETRIVSLAATLDQRGFAAKPILISEIGAAALYGYRDQCAFPWSEEYQSEYLAEAARVIISGPRISGVSFWQFCDGRTYSSNRSLTRPRTFNNKGILDEYRRPKSAYHTVTEIFKKLM